MNVKWKAWISVAVVTAGAGAWWIARGSGGGVAAFPGFQGDFDCGDFGIPDGQLPKLSVTDESKVLFGNGRGRFIWAGRITPEADRRARFELSSEAVHAPELRIDSLASHYLEANGADVDVVGMRDGRELYRHRCRRY